MATVLLGNEILYWAFNDLSDAERFMDLRTRAIDID